MTAGCRQARRESAGEMHVTRDDRGGEGRNRRRPTTQTTPLLKSSHEAGSGVAATPLNAY
jgi:hypothetical protein